MRPSPTSRRRAAGREHEKPQGAWPGSSSARRANPARQSGAMGSRLVVLWVSRAIRAQVQVPFGLSAAFGGPHDLGPETPLPYPNLERIAQRHLVGSAYGST